MNDSKQIAAISAVLSLLSNEPEHRYQAPIVSLPLNSYNAQGRLQTMQYRDLTQRRLVKRTR